MAIDFGCPHCGAKMRTADGTAGKRAKCPSCGQIVTIPMPGQPAAAGPTPPAPPPEPSFPDFGSPARETEFPDFGSPSAPQFDPNPFAAPGGGMPATPPRAATSGAYRDGPPWEREGASFGSFCETIRMAYQPKLGELFSQLRREGGFGAPYWFAVIGSAPGVVVGTATQTLIDLATGATTIDELPFMVVFYVFALPILLLVGTAANLFIGGGIMHLVLRMLEGANHPFESTYRAVAYTQGTANLWNAVPCVGGIIAFVMYFVLMIPGLAKMQETTSGKSAWATFTPIILSCVCGIFFGIAAIAMIGVIATANP